MAEIDFLAAFLAGLLGGVHCLGMCGGIVSALSLNTQMGNKSTVTGFLLAYNSGRLLSYMLAGALLGGLSFLASHLLDIHSLQNHLRLLSAVLMLMLGLYLGGWWQGLLKIENMGQSLWQYIEPLSRRLFPVQSIKNAFLLGIFWGWLPCGLVYTLLFWAIASADAVKGALIMLSFGLGTLPTLLAMGWFALQLRQFIHHQLSRQVAGGLLVLFAFYYIWLWYNA